MVHRARVRARERAGAGGGGVEPAADEVVVAERPVSDGRASFGALLARFEETAGQAQRVAAEQ
jgi:hypothetical protein